MLALASDLPDKSRRGPQVLRQLVHDEISRWTPIIRDANVKVD